MSGIAAISGDSFPEGNLMPQMLEQMKHRGTEKKCIIEEKNFILGYKGLPVTDLQGKGQPLSNQEKDLYIVCNGEVYNHQDLRKQLLQDQVFESNCEGETILYLYEKYGVEALDYLEDGFAFIIADQRQSPSKLFVARDTLGIKPLYYGKKGKNLFFASELKSLNKWVDELQEFPPGHYFTPETGFVEYNKISMPKMKILENEVNQEEVSKNIRRLLNESIEKNLEADVPIGLLLSGGLDSSLIAALATQQNKGQQFKSFCVGSSNSNDIPRAREVAKKLGTKHYEYIYSEEELVEAIPKVIYYLESFDPSLVRSAIPSYFVFKLASQHVNLVLSGEGADELFSGYAYLKDIKDSKKLDKEIIRVLQTVHNIGLQRADRMSMANSVNVRSPFLDNHLMDYALSIPMNWKIHGKDEEGKEIEKWILRKSFNGETNLPPSVLWRNKEEFSEGSGAKDAMQYYVENVILDETFDEEKKMILKKDGVTIRSKEELYYYKIFKDIYPESYITKTVGRWATA